jgi:hypothetical protein
LLTNGGEESGYPGSGGNALANGAAGGIGGSGSMNGSGNGGFGGGGGENGVDGGGGGGYNGGGGGGDTEGDEFGGGGGGSYSASTPTLAVGGAQSGNGVVIITPILPPTTLAITSVNPGSESYGSLTPVTVQATLSWSAGGTAPSDCSGFTFNSTAGGTYGAASVVSSTSTSLICQAVFTPTATDIAAGYVMSANYAGNTSYASSSSNLSTLNFSIIDASTTTTISSIVPNSIVYGSGTSGNITVTVGWSGSGGAPVTCNELEFNGNAPVSIPPASETGITANSLTCVAAVNPSAHAAVGSYNINATAEPSANYVASNSGSAPNFSVTQQTPSLSIASVIPDSVPQGSGMPVTVTLTLTWLGAGAPPATDCSPFAFISTASGNYGPPSLVSSGSNSLTCQAAFTPDLADPVNSYSMFASYAGNTNYQSSGSSASVLNFSITPVDNVASQMRIVQTGFSLNRVTKLWTATMTITNTSASAITGPVDVVLNGLPASVTMSNSTGTYGVSPYITVSANDLAPGASASVYIEFTNPNGVSIAFTPVTYSGAI